MQKPNQKIAILYCMIIGTAKAFLKHMFLTCCITTRLTKCLDRGNRTFLRVVFFSSFLQTHSTPFSSSTKSRSIISVRLWLSYRRIQHKSNFLLDFEARKTRFRISVVGLSNSITSCYLYLKDFFLIGSLPWFRAKIVKEFTRAVSSMYANITKVNFLEMPWPTISVPPFLKSYILYSSNLWQLSSFVVPNIGSRVENMRTFFFPVDDFTTYEGNNKVPSFWQ